MQPAQRDHDDLGHRRRHHQHQRGSAQRERCTREVGTEDSAPCRSPPGRRRRRPRSAGRAARHCPRPLRTPAAPYPNAIIRIADGTVKPSQAAKRARVSRPHQPQRDADLAARRTGEELAERRRCRRTTPRPASAACRRTRGGNSPDARPARRSWSARDRGRPETPPTRPRPVQGGRGRSAHPLGLSQFPAPSRRGIDRPAHQRFESLARHQDVQRGLGRPAGAGHFLPEIRRRPCVGRRAGRPRPQRWRARAARRSDRRDPGRGQPPRAPRPAETHRPAPSRKRR